MMRNLIIAFSLLFFITIPLKADMPPPAGYERVNINLVTETKEDLTDYRFFLTFFGALHEVKIKSKGRSEIPPVGGGARYSTGILMAIPKDSLKEFDGELTYEQLGNLSRLIGGKKIEGVVELLKHSFWAEVRKGKKVPEVYYLIKREENTLKAEKITEEKPKSKSSPQSFLPSSRLNYTISVIFITLAVLVGGIFAFRKASKKV